MLLVLPFYLFKSMDTLTKKAEIKLASYKRGRAIFMTRPLQLLSVLFLLYLFDDFHSFQ